MEETTGEDVLLQCEVSGYPPPKVEWNFKRADGVILPMPSNISRSLLRTSNKIKITVSIVIHLIGDDMRKSVQSRGGPGQYQVTAWLQLQALEIEDAGVYTCIGRNKLGKASADATITVTRSE